MKTLTSNRPPLNRQIVYQYIHNLHENFQKTLPALELTTTTHHSILFRLLKAKKLLFKWDPRLNKEATVAIVIRETCLKRLNSLHCLLKSYTPQELQAADNYKKILLDDLHQITEILLGPP